MNSTSGYKNLFNKVNRLRNGIVHGNPKEDIREEFYKDDATMYQKLKELSEKINDFLFKEKI